MTNIYDIKPTKFKGGGNYEIRHYIGEGPAFGGGTDLGIHGDKYDLNGWTWFPHSFIDALGKGKSVFTGDIDNNNIHFKVKEVEVFKIT